MIKVLLVFEDFNELTLSESNLRRVGFDVVGISNEVLLLDQILGFNPDIIVAYGRSSRVSSFSVGQKLKENHKFHGKLAIIVPKDSHPSPADILKMKMDAIMEAPIEMEKFIQLLARLANQSPKMYLEKLFKARYSDNDRNPIRVPRVPNAAPEENSQFVRGPIEESGKVVPLPTPSQEESESESSRIPLRDPERAKKYAEIAQEVDFDVEQSTHQRKEIREIQKDLKKDWNFEQLEELDKLKREFAQALFKKKS